MNFFTDLLSKNLRGTEWIGEVEFNSDPDFLGRCKVRVFGIFDGKTDDLNDKGSYIITTEQLPWAYPSNGIFFGSGDSKGAGNLSVPKIGSKVKIIFNGGNMYSPEYTFIQDVNEDIANEIKDSYEDSHVILFDKDQQLKILYTKKDGIKISLKGSHIKINPDGSISLFTDNEVMVDAKSIKLGKEASESLLLGETFQQYFNNHTHMGNLGAPTGIPIIPSDNTHLSSKSFTE